MSVVWDRDRGRGRRLPPRRQRTRAEAISPAHGGEDPAGESYYIATRTRGRTVNFKGEDEADGEEVGPVFITDDDDPDFLYEVGWMKLSDARELAGNLGHAFNAD